MFKRMFYAASLLIVAVSARAVEAPSVLTQTDYDGQSLTLSWNTVEGATGYLVSVWNLGASVSEAQNVNLAINKDNPTLYTPAVDGHLDEVVFSFNVSGTDGVDNAQTLPLIFRQADADHQVSSIFRGDIYVGQLAPYNQLSSNSVFGGYPLDEFTECLYIQAGPQGEQPSAPGTLTITRVENTYRPNVYVKKDEAVGADVTSVKVTGLDASSNYYAAVKTVAGNEVSLPSEVLRLNDLIPTSLTGATAVASDSYTANWEANPKACSYVVTNYEIVKCNGSTPLSENGDKCTDGTFDEPVEVDSFDGYTASNGWDGFTCLVSQGMFGVPDGQIRGGRPMGGYLISPPVDLSANNGRMTVTVEFQATPGDVINVYAGTFSSDKIKAVTIPDNGNVSETFEISGGSKECNVHFDSTKLKKFFIRNLTIAQGEPVEMVILEDDFDKSTEGTFDSPIERISADDYTAMPGWRVNSAIAATGMFGTFDGMVIAGRNYGGGEMTTPPLGFAEGSATVSFRLQSSKPGEDEILVYAGDYNPDAVTVIPVPADGIVEQTVTLSGVSDGMEVHIDSKLLKKFMLDNIKISQTLLPGQKSYVKGESATVTDATSYTFAGLNPDSEYGYSVRTDYKDFFGIVYEGAESEIMEVGILSGVENVSKDVENLSPIVSVIFTDLSGRRLMAPAPGTVVIRTEVHADGSHTVSKLVVR